MVKELRETLRAMWVRLRRTENWIFGMSQMPLIVEEGTSGIWRYRKWSNGVAECWGRTAPKDYACGTNTSGYGYYVSESQYLPTNLFTSVVAGFGDRLQGEGTYPSNTLITININTLTTTEIRYWVQSASSSTQSLAISLYVIGSWKATTDTPQNLIDYLYDNHVWDYNYLSNLPKINGQTVSGSKTLADYGFTGEIANDKIGYTTTAPTAANTDGLKIVVLEEEPETKYDGWLYIIVESEEE